MTIAPWDVFSEFAAVADPDCADAPPDADGLTPAQRMEQLLRCERNLAAWECAVKAEADRLAAKLRAVQGRRESVRGYLAGVMRSAGERRYKSPAGTVSLSPGRERIEVDAERVWDWPDDVIDLAVTDQLPKVSIAALKELPPDRMAALAGVTVTRGDDVLTIR